MNNLIPISLSGLLIVGVVALSSADETSSTYGSDAYATCAACHLPDGIGVPGAFPPIRNRVAAIAALDGGRDYLITVVSYGLMGTINVSGSQYFGVMAGNAGAMSAEDIAAALNYVIFELNDVKPVESDPISSEEVERVQAGVSVKGPGIAAEMRKALVDRSSDL